MLQFTSENTLRMHIAHFFDLECAFKTRGMLVATAHDKKRLLVHKDIVCEILVLFVARQHCPNLIRERMQAIDNFVTTAHFRKAVFGEMHSHHDQRNVLRRICLGRRHANLRACIDVDTTVRLARDRASHRVYDTQTQSATA